MSLRRIFAAIAAWWDDFTDEFRDEEYDIKPERKK